MERLHCKIWGVGGGRLCPFWPVLWACLPVLAAVFLGFLLALINPTVLFVSLKILLPLGINSIPLICACFLFSLLH